VNNLTPEQQQLRRVVCAAIRKGDVLLTGPRHYDGVMRRQLDVMGRTSLSGGDGEQGFIDQWGNFMTREEAWWVAVARNQILRYVGNQTPESRREGAELYSENLY
jgi:hypothetical protein